MKRIPYVADRLLVHVSDGQIATSERKPVMASQFMFLSTRVADDSFAAELSAIERMRLAIKTMDELEQQKELAPERGYWELEDSRADAIERSTREPKAPYNTAFVKTYLPFIEAVEKMEPAPPATSKG